MADEPEDPREERSVASLIIVGLAVMLGAVVSAGMVLIIHSGHH